MTSPENLNYKYPGTGNLVLIEIALTNYNEWVVDKFMRVFSKGNGRAARVLDFGSGLGTLSKIFYKKTGVRPDAFDIDAVHRAEIVKSGFRAYADIAELPDNYDLIFTSNVLEHIEDDLGILKAIGSHMKKDGTLLIYVPAFMFLWTAMDDMVEHVRRYSKKELCDKLRYAGFDIEYVGYCDSVGFVLSILFRCIGRKDGAMPLRSLTFYDKVLLPVSKVTDVLFCRFFGKNLYAIAKKK